MLVTSPIAGKITDKINPGLVSTIGISLISLGIAIMALINESTNMGLLLITLIFFGLGNGLFLPSNTKAVITSADKKDYGVTGATLNDTRVIGQIMGIAIVLFVFNTFLGDNNIATTNHLELLMSIKVSLILLLLVSAFGIIISALTIEFNGKNIFNFQISHYIPFLSNKFLSDLKKQKDNILRYFK